MPRVVFLRVRPGEEWRRAPWPVKEYVSGDASSLALSAIMREVVLNLGHGR